MIRAEPAVYGAFGMAAAYYTYPLLISAPKGFYIILGLLFLLAAITAFSRVLKSLSIIHIKNAGKFTVLAAAVAAGFSLGIASRRTVPSGAELGFKADRITALSGTLREDPRTLNGGSGIGRLALLSSAASGGMRSSAGGSITVFFPSESIPRLKEFGRGSQIYVEGSILAGNSLSERAEPVFRASSVHIVKPAPAIEQFRTGLRMKLIDRFQNRRSARGGKPAGGPVWGGLASALLLGVRDDLDADLSEGFRNSGCTHILALSGMHLAILSGVLAFFLRRVLGIRWASLAGAVFIVFYIFIAGSQPSLVRAGIMYLLGTFALWGLLNTKPFPLLCMAFIIQLIFQSESGTSLSFILSYLALGGILTLGESIRSLLKGRLPEIISGGLSASLGAFIITAPVVVFCFGSLRPIGIAAGLILAPLASLFMLFSLAALAASFLPTPLWEILDLALTGIYRFLEFLVSLAGRVPGISFANPYPVLVFTLVFWLLLLFTLRRDRLYRDTIASFD